MCTVVVITESGEVIIGGQSKLRPVANQDPFLATYKSKPRLQVVRSRPRATKKELLGLLTTSQATHIGFAGGSRNRRVERLWA